MTPTATAAPQEDGLTEIVAQPIATAPEPGDSPSQGLYKLVAQQRFFAGLSPHHLQLLTDSAMEMQFAPGQMILEEGSPANRFYLILEGKVVLEIGSRGARHGSDPNTGAR